MRLSPRYPIARVSLAAAGLLLLAIGGCQAAVITAPGYVDPDEPPTGADPEMLFVTGVQPLLQANCANCHAGGPRGPEFIDNADAYTSVLAYPGLVTPGEPEQSLLSTKGQHDGPPWNSAQLATVNAWITAEGDNPIEPGDGRETPAIDVTPGSAHSLPLDTVGLAGSALQFDAANSASGLLITDIEIRAGSAVSFSQPRFIIYDASGNRIADRASFVTGTEDLRFTSGRTSAITSTWIINGFPDGGRLAVEFMTASIPQ